MRKLFDGSKLSRAFLVLLLTAVSFQLLNGAAFAEIFQPVIVEPYDKNSLKKLKSSYASLESNLGKLEHAGDSLEKVSENYKSNPTEENEAALVEKTGKAAEVSINTLNNTEKVLGIITPELQKYRDHLKKINRDMQKRGNDSLYSEFGSWSQDEIEELERLLVDMEEVKGDIKAAKKVIADATNVWMIKLGITKNLKQLLPAGDIGRFFEGLAAFFKPLARVKDLILSQVHMKSLSSDGDYDEKKEVYTESRNGFFGTGI